MATYLSRVRAITGSTTTQTSNIEVVDFLKAGSNYVVMSIPKELLWFSYTVTTFSSNAGVTVPQNTIISVMRNNRQCEQIPTAFSYVNSTTLTSLYEGSTFFPKYYLQEGKVYVDPTPTTGALGRLRISQCLRWLRIRHLQVFQYLP